MFCNDMTIGIKQPYMKVSYNGILTLRNDNPKNLILKFPEPNPEEQREMQEIINKQKIDAFNDLDQ